MVRVTVLVSTREESTTAPSGPSSERVNNAANKTTFKSSKTAMILAGCDIGDADRPPGQCRAAEAPYRACLTNCAFNNRAGKGVIAALNGMAQCNSSCAPLKWGGEVIPPSWERDKLRLRTVECMITRISRNQATASCR